jgi:predicted  nucleic acid-binding Zn-ribbon protein
LEVSAAELLDKIANLRVQIKHASHPERCRRLQDELDRLQCVRQSLEASPALSDLEMQLQEVNERICELQEEARKQEPLSLEVSQSLWHAGEHRAGIKRAINELLHCMNIDYL